MIIPGFLIASYILSFLQARKFIKKEKSLVKYRLKLYFEEITSFFTEVFFGIITIASSPFVFPLLISFLSSIGILNPDIVALVEAMFNSEIVQRYGISVVISYFSLVFLTSINQEMFGEPSEVLNPSEIVVSEIEYLTQHLEKRPAIHRDILKKNLMRASLICTYLN